MSTRGTTNANARGSAADRRRRREYLVATYRANVDVAVFEGVELELDGEPWPIKPGLGVPACRCYCCGVLLTVATVTVDRIVPGCKGGTYRRENIRPACGHCNSSVGGALRSAS